MLQIAWVLGTVGPFNPGLRFIRPATAALWTGLRLLFAAACAIAAYGMSLNGVTRLCSPQQPLAAPVYAVGLALATFLGIAAATLAAPRRLAGFTVPCSGILVVILPALFLLRAGATATYALYLAGAFAGCVSGTRFMLWARARRASVAPST